MAPNTAVRGIAYNTTHNSSARQTHRSAPAGYPYLVKPSTACGFPESPMMTPIKSIKLMSVVMTMPVTFLPLETGAACVPACMFFSLNDGATAILESSDGALLTEDRA